MKNSFRIAILGLFLATWPVTTFSQAVFGGIAGTVTDPSGAAVPGAKVNITETGKGVSYNTITNDSGNDSHCSASQRSDPSPTAMIQPTA